MSTLNVANISDGTDTVATGYVVSGSAKASFRYDQATNTVLSSKNVSSVVDDSAGEFTVNCTSAFLSLDTQRLSGVVQGGTGRVITTRTTGATNSALPFRTTGNGATTDTDNTSSGVVMGDLA
jgi:hypothetical protein